MSRVLVIRLSALGDVAMLVPVLYSAAKYYPDDEFYLLTKSPLLPLFEHRPDNVRVIPFYAKDKHKGFGGLLALIRQLASLRFDKIADTHDVLRSKPIRFFFRLKGKQTASIRKGRAEKRALTKQHGKQFKPLKTSIERYLDVFSSLGYRFTPDFVSVFDYGLRDFSLIKPVTGAQTGDWIGIAPFAKHQGKTYPVEKTGELIRLLAGRDGTRIFLFGGKDEEVQLEEWASQYENVTSVSGHFTFSAELLLMSYLKVMLTMDSGNMHMASLVGTPVVSVWGATHPYAGFFGYGQDPANIVQVDNLPCRPCSVFGQKPCFRKDYACLNRITPVQIVNQIEKVISLHESNN